MARASKARPRKGDLLLVQWDDACASSGWTPLNEVDASLSRILTVGVLLTEPTADVLVLAQNVDALSASYSNILNIPAPLVRSIRILVSRGS